MPVHDPGERDCRQLDGVSILQRHGCGVCRSKRPFSRLQSRFVGLGQPAEDASAYGGIAGTQLLKFVARSIETCTRFSGTAAIEQQPSEQHRAVAGVERIVAPIECRHRRPQRSLRRRMTAAVRALPRIVQELHRAGIHPQ